MDAPYLLLTVASVITALTLVEQVQQRRLQLEQWSQHSAQITTRAWQAFTGCCNNLTHLLRYLVCTFANLLSPSQHFLLF